MCKRGLLKYTFDSQQSGRTDVSKDAIRNIHSGFSIDSHNVVFEGRLFYKQLLSLPDDTTRLTFINPLLIDCDWTIVNTELQRLQHIQKLCITCDKGNKMSDRHLEVLQHFPYLEDLTIKNSRISEKGLHFLEYTPRLKKLDVSTNTNINRLDFAVYLKGLESINVSDTNIKDSSLYYFKYMRGLKSINIGYTYISEHGLEFLNNFAKHNNVEEILSDGLSGDGEDSDYSDC